MALTTEQMIEMQSQMRAEKTAGRPEVAQRIQKALDRGEPYEVTPVVVKDALPVPPTSGPGSGKEKWTEFALDASDMDPEIIEAASKKDLIAMLRANGVIPFPEVEEDDDV
ncbi:MAG: hypothetical protein QNL12_05600 [Acidimicrobiia bacterium]|nr:hypothetical protein [Acidimicrobiia bacterium]MDX2466768.1 hypothetical protein [Acidimicrobiia bacterium]